MPRIIQREPLENPDKKRMHHIKMLLSKLLKHSGHFHDGAKSMVILFYSAAVFTPQKSHCSAKSNQNLRRRGTLLLDENRFPQRISFMASEIDHKTPQLRRRTNKIKTAQVESRCQPSFWPQDVQGWSKRQA